MTRRIVLALAAALALPTFSAAQEPASKSPATRVTVSPFLGYAFAFEQKGTVDISGLDSNLRHVSYSGSYSRRVAGGMMPGLIVDVRLPGRFGASFAGAYNKRGTETLSTQFVELPPLEEPGETFWFTRAALTMELTDEGEDLRVYHPTAQISVGPAFIRTVPASVSSANRTTTNTVGLNAAANMELPTAWKGLSVRAAMEDYVADLPNDGAALDLGTDINGKIDGTYYATLTRRMTHMFAIRLGLAYRF